MLKRTIKHNNDTHNITFCLNRDISNLGYYTTLINEVNEAIGTLEEIVLFDENITNEQEVITDSNPFIVSGYTDSRLEDVKTFNVTNPYQVGINGVTEVTNDYVIYVIDDITFKTLLDDNQTTTYFFSSKGLELSKTYNKPIIKEDDIHFVEKPRVKSDINIDRFPITVFDRHIRASLIKDLSLFKKYPNNYFNL